jgi:hypothetical protein
MYLLPDKLGCLLLTYVVLTHNQIPGYEALNYC